jgi:hypothetical protein
VASSVQGASAQVEDEFEACFIRISKQDEGWRVHVNNSQTYPEATRICSYVDEALEYVRIRMVMHTRRYEQRATDLGA